MSSLLDYSGTTPLSTRKFIERIMQEFQKALKEFMDKMCQLMNGLATYHRSDAMERKFKIATCTDNGLAKHSQEIKAFILSQNIGISLVLQILLTKAINKSYFRIPEYTVSHNVS